MSRDAFVHKVLLAADRHLAPVRPRRVLLTAGRHLSEGQIGVLRTVVGAVEEGRLLAQSKASVPNLADRFALFGEAVRRTRGTAPLYLEFGVYRGRTLRWWSEHLSAPGAHLVGFDSFRGLPERWRGDAPQGTFEVQAPPRIDDPRVSFVVGWFKDTLAGWRPPEHDQLVVNVDCDLYSSTASVLGWLDPYLRPGTLVYFDDLIDREDELRAFREWTESLGGRVRPVAMARWGRHLLVEVGGPAQDA
jgi:hypothetical protein